MACFMESQLQVDLDMFPRLEKKKFIRKDTYGRADTTVQFPQTITPKTYRQTRKRQSMYMYMEEIRISSNSAINANFRIRDHEIAGN
jgi:hypothetical protein